MYEEVATWWDWETRPDAVGGGRTRTWTPKAWLRSIHYSTAPAHSSTVTCTRELRGSTVGNLSVQAPAVAFNQEQSTVDALTFCCFREAPSSGFSLLSQSVCLVWRAEWRGWTQYQWRHYSPSLTNRFVSRNLCFHLYASSISHHRMNASLLTLLFTIKNCFAILFFNEEKGNEIRTKTKLVRSN